MGKLDRTWQLFKASWNVLALDPEILWLPVISGLSLLLVTASFVLPLYRTGIFEVLRAGKAAPETYVILFAWYYTNFFVGIFFNSALVGCANIRLSGGDPTLSQGFHLAWSRIGKIALWALVSATVGLLLRSLQDRRNGFLVNLLFASLGLAWSLITYLMVPVILFENRGIYDSVYRSEELFRDHWGEQVAGDFGFGLLNFLLCLPAFVFAFFLWPVDRSLAVIVCFYYILLVSIVSYAVKGIFTVALYRYATSGEAPAGFSANVIDDVLGGHPKPPRFIDTPGSTSGF